MTYDETLELLDPAPYLALVEQALAEDHAEQDVTARALLARDKQVTADVVTKQSGVLCGLPLMDPVFLLLDPSCEVTSEYEDGGRVGDHAVVLTVTGPARAVLSGERTALNFLGRLSGIATMTSEYVEHTMATGSRIYDTRKTTPGWRTLEKYAVRCGGGENHRMHLADAAMIKENHLKAAYGRTGPEALAAAVTTCRDALPDGTPLYVEVENQAELEAAIGAGATIVMLDDFDLGQIREAVRFVRKQPQPWPQIEVTGGVRLDTVEALAAAGGQRLSVGRLTHSAPNFDFSMRVVAS